MTRHASRPPLHQRYWPPSAPGVGALLVVHGLSEHAGRYSRLAQEANRSGFAVAAVDLYGHGKSPGRRGHIRDFAADHLGAVDELVRRVEKQTPGLPLILVGHSLGGLIVARWAQRRVFARRLRGLALIAPFVEPRMRIPRWKTAAAAAFARFAPTISLPTGIREADLFRDEAERARYASDPLVQRRISAGHWAAITRERALLREGAAELAVPTLVQLAGEDRIVDTDAARALAERLPEATLIVYPDAYHALHHDPATGAATRDLLAWACDRAEAA